MKNHAMLLALAKGLKLVFPGMTEAVFDRLEQHILKMSIARQRALSADHPIVQSFWETYDLLNVEISGANFTYEIETLNHSSDTSAIAVSLKHFYQVCVDRKVESIPTLELEKYITNSKRHRFIGQRSVRSRILNKSVWCWCFDAQRTH